jgi:hypothetical protein
MRKVLALYKQFAEKMHLHHSAHHSRITGRPPASGYSFTLYDSISHTPESAWDTANATGGIFLSSAYLTAVEQAPPENMRFRYAIISKGDTILGIAYFQIVTLNYRLHKPLLQKSRSATANPLLQKVHNKIIDTAGTTLLVCGNAMISGEHGFSIPTLPVEQALHVVAEIAHAIRTTANPRITVTLIKDFYKKEPMPSDILSQFGYHLINAGPNMILQIRNTWPTFDAYLKAMKPKYRKRATAAIRKGSGIRRQPLTLENIIQRRDELFVLYCRVVDKARFKLFFLTPDYLVSLKKHLGDSFECIGYFHDKELVGFSTRIPDGTTLEGYTHGLNYDRNKEFELYQNFLLDDVKAAITTHASQVNTGRTSIAMKSSIGAAPGEMVCYLRFSAAHSNHLFKPLLFFIKPSNDYCRNPFDDSSEE